MKKKQLYAIYKDFYVHCTPKGNNYKYSLSLNDEIEV